MTTPRPKAFSRPSIKREEVYLNHYETFSDVEGQIGRFIDDVYNQKQLQITHISGAGHNIRREQFDHYIAAVRSFLESWAAAYR